MNFIIMISLGLTFIMMNSNHPLIFMIMILTQTLLVCLLTWGLASTSWLAFTLFLIFIGGLMVLFIYISSLASNEQFNLTMKKYMYVIISSMLIFPLLIMSKNLTMSINPVNNMISQTNILFSTPMGLSLTLMIIYLLITLIIVVKISKKTEGPIRFIKFK